MQVIYRKADVTTARTFMKKYPGVWDVVPTYLDIWNYLADNNIVAAGIERDIRGKGTIEFSYKKSESLTETIPSTLIDSDGDFIYDKLAKWMVLEVLSKKMI